MKNSNENQRTKCEIWTRGMGYHRPVSNFNKGKVGEFLTRKYYKPGKTNERFTNSGEQQSSSE